MIKIAIGLFIGALVTMIIGLVLIGITKDGFFTLKFWGVGGILQIDALDKELITNAGTNLGTLQSGAVFAAIITPILFGLSILVFGYNYLSKQNK